MNKWNGNIFTVDNNSLSMLEIVEEHEEKIKEKTDLHGDHLGSWQGIQRPTLSEEGMRGTVEKHITDIANIESDIVNVNETLDTYGINLNNLNLDNENNKINIQDLKDSKFIVSENRNSLSYKCEQYLKNRVQVGDGAFPCMAKDGDRIIIVYRSGEHHTSYDGVIKQVVSNNNGLTWGEPITILTDIGNDLRDPNLVKIKDGLLLVVTKRLTNEDREVKVYKSFDGGLSWEYKCSLPDANDTTGNMQVRGNIEVLEDGSILIPVYYQTIWGSYLVKSTDNGNSFKFLSWITKGRFNETSIKNVNGKLIAVLRKTYDVISDSNTFLSISNDNGITWSPLKDLGYCIQAPWIASIKGNIIVFGRNQNTNSTISGETEFIYCILDKKFNVIGKPITLEHNSNWDIAYSNVIVDGENVHITSYTVDKIYYSIIPASSLLLIEELNHTHANQSIKHLLEGKEWVNITNYNEITGITSVVGDGINSYMSKEITLPVTVNKFLYINATACFPDIDGKYVVNVGSSKGNKITFIIRHTGDSPWSTEKMIYFNLKYI